MKTRDLLLVVFFGAALYFAVFGGEYGLFEVRRLERERIEEVARLDGLRAEVDRLRLRADALEDDPAVLERIARERYGLIRDGERLYRFAEPEEVPEADEWAPAPDAGSGRRTR